MNYSYQRTTLWYGELGDIFAPRQALALTTLARLVRESRDQLRIDHEPLLADAVGTCLGLVVGRQCDFQSSLVTWTAGGEFAGLLSFDKHWEWFGISARPIFGLLLRGNWDGATDWVARVIAQEAAAHSCTGTLNRHRRHNIHSQTIPSLRSSLTHHTTMRSRMPICLISSSYGRSEY